MMKSSTPRDDLPGMFKVLQDYAEHFKFCDADLEKALDAMQDGDRRLFKKIRKGSY